MDKISNVLVEGLHGLVRTLLLGRRTVASDLHLDAARPRLAAWSTPGRDDHTKERRARTKGFILLRCVLMPKKVMFSHMMGCMQHSTVGVKK